MKKIILLICILFNTLFSAQIEELSWQKGESFLTFLEKNKIPLKLYYDLDKEDQELCSEIQSGNRFFSYTEEDGSLIQALIPVSLDMQIHIYKDSSNEYKFQTLPINYTEKSELIAIPITESISNDIQKATGDVTIAAILNTLFSNSNADFKKMKKGDFIAIEYNQKTYMGKLHGMPEINAAMIQINGKPFYRFRNSKDDKYYDENGVGFTKTYLFQIPLTFTRISSPFTNKRYHPVLKRYRAHLGTDFAAPTGRNIYAASDGKVEFVGTQSGYGKTVIINHQNGYKTLYAHQNGFAKGLRQGQMIKKGTHIGYVGSTGLSSGPHLHLGMYKNNVAIDPMSVLQRPKFEGLDPKEKPIFLANTKAIISKFNNQIENDNRTTPTRLDRISDRSIINLF
ncbi:peptidoglycan DD-metalloendopeptidase family protein [Aliarcobacter cryaerophilus]|uniref:Peptidoglycan DD-metalloendopeptidase family protein n=1 Tax=Aliarcobacter cryaerophilus TaxID=28198 RepID=A0AA46NCU7_9BACT|nr:peptidoglycan DD-metalloendopeptidase family protein [Aliarcobacter cryaerophilus]MCT7405107.1 peptidoglycan DD-metalloendopeptidase family protein [Aliarcobacter cryaerophilus]MCT7463935.1 peptidoglycan DD-metalloendopeptidase family protein [Aliarcobacter cryaerophilus]MCT7502852.1 peptidoglycan DD-metalloendopeptidase family protein [Aliarcobacter cryaerophilus]MCT7527707.1 peptidoglycan DD-metalloendopeptidase family protein [Aliarcobacter cryaerophilus]UYF42947.1 peptidoglycan DD-metal